MLNRFGFLGLGFMAICAAVPNRFIGAGTGRDGSGLIGVDGEMAEVHLYPLLRVVLVVVMNFGRILILRISTLAVVCGSLAFPASLEKG